LAVWIFFSFFVSLGANVLANAFASDSSDASSETIMRQAKIVRAFVLASPMQLYTDATATIIDPMRKHTSSSLSMGQGPMETLSMARFAGPLPLGQSILIVAPYIITLIALTVVCFAISYTVFMRQEIRSL
jgi:ABC-2 type transport system permease protein